MEVLLTYRKELDVLAYEECVGACGEVAQYARASFLDGLIGEGWAVLHTSDYGVVMPLPLKRFWGLEIVYMPVFCQQLGIFSFEPLAETVAQRFFLVLMKRFFVRHYHFNSRNNFGQATKLNLILGPSDYALLFKGYKAQRRNKIRKNVSRVLVALIDYRQASDFLRQHLGTVGGGDWLFEEQMKGLERLERGYKGLSYFGGFVDGALVNVVVLAELGNRKVMLINCTDKKYSGYQPASVVIDGVLQRYSSRYVFDFEGSVLPGVKAFFMGFSPVEEHYPVLVQGRLEMLISRFLSWLNWRRKSKGVKEFWGKFFPRN
ncbi:hypothetical protein [Bergeyella sp. RCAD1439]|uniref:hypothetical protein n=1 Tax=Bergeyella anatis TaxID=3113737 RepID=UPI002E193622|nr:hypothetical protein [Bergeyella sp. RCAD1439]